MGDRAVIVVEFDWPETDTEQNFHEVTGALMPQIRESIREELHPQATIAIDEVADRVIGALHSQDGTVDLLEYAWGIIANVSEGNWAQQTEEWQTAAIKWRDQWHATLPAPLPPPMVPVDPIPWSEHPRAAYSPEDGGV